jgi:hypothetical protein
MRSSRALARRFGRHSGGSHPVMTDDTPALGGAGCAGAGPRAEDGRDSGAEKDRIASGEGVQAQIDRGADIREQNGLTGPGAGRPGTPERAQGMPERGTGSPESSPVPRWLQTGAGWSWRLLILAAAIYLVARVLSLLSIVVVPCIVALLRLAALGRKAA